MRNRRLALAIVAASAVAASSIAPVFAQQYPSKPIRLVLPFPPGAPSDLVGRTIGQKMGEQMGQNLIPDNRTGAGGTLGLSTSRNRRPMAIPCSSPHRRWR